MSATNTNPDPEEEKKEMPENHDADSNSSDATSNNGNKNKPAKKKTLSEMLKKLHPDQINGLELADIPTFLKKESPPSTDPDLPVTVNETNTPNNHKSPNTVSPSQSPTSTQTKVSSPKLNADVYKCAVKNCTKSFSHVNDFKQHINNQHADVDNLPCCFCFNSFVQENYFDHLSSHIKNLMKCLYCQVSHDTREELLKHLSDKHPNQPKKINVCIRILNNVRGKKSHSDTNSESKVNVKSQSKPQSECCKKLDLGNSLNEAPKSRNRKASKPLKTLNQTENSDEIEIEYVKETLPIKCTLCSFTCNTDIHMKQHVQDGHEHPSSCTLFRCKQCKTNFDDKDAFETHLSHHGGKHTIRYYTCPYCTTISNNMETIENHIADAHVDKAFRFEVLQEVIEHLQDLVICPICKGTYRWQSNFIKHLESVHILKDLASYFTSTYPDQKLPSYLKAFRSHFKNLLPDAPDFDNETSRNLFLAPADDNVDNDESNENADVSVKTESSDTAEKKENKSTEHPLLYGMLSKKLNEPTIHPVIVIQPSSSPSSSPPTQSSESLQYLDRYPPPDLAQFVIKKGTPTTFNCNLCPFECTKTTHFRRHMDIHKRNESLTDGYKCGYCQFAHPRLNCIRFHLGKYHADLPYMMTRIVDNSYINMGPEDDPTLKKSKAKVPFVTSTPVISQRPERERRAPIKMETDFDWRAGRSPGKMAASGSIINCDHMSISEFEQNLPSIMIFPDVYKCPKCDFTNRVRVNLLNHLKIHKAQGFCKEKSVKQEKSDIENVEESSVDDENNDEDACAEDKNDDEGEEDGEQDSELNPLFDYLSDKKNTSDLLGDAEEVTFVTRANLTDEYKHFSVKIPNSNHYQCKECNFIHRYPSKVKRHYYYKHAPAFPYKCGYCSFGAVEGGKVKRHCKIVHPNKREMVVKRNVYKKGSAGNDATKSNNGGSRVSNASSTKVLPQEEEDCETEQDSVKIKKQYVYKCNEDNNDLWLPQFVTLLDDDVQCCKLCGYQQDGSSSLREHVLTAHLEFYPYSCSHCGFALMDLSRVRKHIDTHHPGMNYSAFHRCIVDNENNDNNHVVRNNGENEFSDENDSQNSQMVIDESSQLEHESIEFNDDDIDETTADKDSSTEEGESEMIAPAPTLRINKPAVFDSFSGKRQFKCYYCGVISKWNRRDIRLHVLHVHLRKKVYTCRHCGFGNSKSKAIVKTHCMKFHPNKNVSVKDELALFNAIVPIEDANGIVTMVLCDKNGQPVLELAEDGSIATKSDSKSPVKISSLTPQKAVIAIKSSSPLKILGGSSNTHECHWKCKQCSYASSTELDVKYHLLSSHLNVRLYSCPHCHVYLSRAELVLSHIEKYHPDKKKEVSDTLEEKAQYLQKNIEYIGHKRAQSFNNLNEDEDEIDENFAKIMERQKNPRYSSGYFRCLLCGYRDPRNDKTKYHIIKTHLNLRQFSCPHCNQYMWGRQQVVAHIEEEHPGKEIFVKRTFHEYDHFLRKNIKKFSFPKSGSQDENQRDNLKTKSIPRIQCDSCSFVTDSELSLAAHKRTHKIFQCFYCDYKHMLAARVLSHCSEKHPSSLVRFKHVDSSNFESTKVVAEDGMGGLSKDGDDTVDNDGGDATMDDELDDENAAAADNNDGEDDDVGDVNETSYGASTFVCQICQSVRWTKSDILIHSNEMHPDRVPSFVAVKSECNEKLQNLKNNIQRLHENDHTNSDDSEADRNDNINNNDDSQMDDDDDDFEDKSLMIDEVSNIKMNNVANTKFSNISTSQLLKSNDSLYQCRLCTYKSNKMTVMRHHIMSHLRYHPYVCPYCDQAKSVKSFPIKKHVAAKHPGKDIVAMHCTDADQERKIVRSYYKFKVSNSSDKIDFRSSFKANKGISHDCIGGYNDSVDDGCDDDEDDDDFNGSIDNDANQSSNIENRIELDMCDQSSKVDDSEMSFKCKFCSFNTLVKSEMKHHLMKELNYKPYKCNLCPFRDAQKPVISKHYQKQHLTSSPSKNNTVTELKIKEEVNSEKEELIKKLLEECRVSQSVSNNNSTHHSGTSNQQSCNSQSQQRTQLPQPQKFNLKQPIVIQNNSKHNSIPLRSGSKTYKCPECSYTNTSLKLVRGHMVKHGPHRLKCAYCDYKAHYPSRIRKHTRRQHSDRVFNYTNIMDDANNNGGGGAPRLNLLVSRSNDKVDGDEDGEEDGDDGHVNSAAASTSKVFLDGVPIDFPLISHSDGWYRCQFCDYSSMNRDNFKVHLVTHKPRRWKCYYCEQKYPVIFRVRRHCIQKHPRLQIKWLDVETGKVGSDTKPPSYSLPFVGLKKPKQCTARKSFGCRQVNNQLKRKHSMSVDEARLEDLVYDSEVSTYNCHLCHFSHTTPDFLIKHLKVEHVWTDKLPQIEIFPKNDDGEIWALRRCGFCLFESYDPKAFKQHVLNHTIWPPTQCLFCSFASFSQALTVEHVKSEHSVEYKLLEREQKCLMLNDGNIIDNADAVANSGDRDKVSTDTADGVEDSVEKSSCKLGPIEVNRKFLCKELSDEYTMVTDDSEQFKNLDWVGDFEPWVTLVKLHMNQFDEKDIEVGDDEEEDEDEDGDDNEEDDEFDCS